MRKHNRVLIPCACGCGELIINIDKNGRLVRYKYRHILNNQTGKNNPNWKGGKIERYGYILIYNPPTQSYLPEHRLMWEQYYRACILPWGDVHHKNEIKTDNRVENLEAMMHYKHISTHKRKDMSDRECIICHSNDGRQWHYYDSDKTKWLCKKCYDKKRHSQKVKGRSVCHCSQGT